MLIEFRVANHRSIKEEQALTMEAASIGDASDLRPREVEGYSKALLPAAVIYGANASGKSNVLRALNFMREAVLFSHRWWDPEGGVPRTPFAWRQSQQEGSLFEVTFLLEKTKYQYGFVANDEAVEEEWLFAWPKKRKQTWFQRDGNKFHFGDQLMGANESMKDMTRKNALFLSVAVQNNHPQLSSFYRFFQHISTFNVRGMRGPFATTFPMASRADQSSFLTAESESKSLGKIKQLFNAADVGIVDVKRTEIKDPLSKESGYRIQFQHRRGDEDSWLDFRDESAGTQTLFNMAPFIYEALERGAVLVIDELESSLHPLIGLEIVKMFNDPSTNPRNAQILFTTHDTNLLGTIMGDPPLRRDQIWFTEKNPEGATTLYPLTDYKPRNVENLERGYLQGRYGAIPFLGKFAEYSE